MREQTLIEENRGHPRYSSTSDFIDSTWCPTVDGLFPQLLAKRSPAFVTDISTGGLSFLSSKEIKEGEQISVVVAYKKYRTFQLNGRVRFSHKLKNKSTVEIEGTSLDFYRVGIQFLYNDSGALSELSRLLHRLEKQASN